MCKVTPRPLETCRGGAQKLHLGLTRVLPSLAEFLPLVKDLEVCKASTAATSSGRNALLVLAQGHLLQAAWVGP